MNTWVDEAPEGPGSEHKTQKPAVSGLRACVKRAVIRGYCYGLIPANVTARIIQKCRLQND